MMELKCFDRIVVHDVKVKPRSIRATYTLEFDGLRKSYNLIQSYREDIEVRGIDEIARLISIVPAINYGLFTDEISFKFPLHELDYRFFTDMSEATARDIFVNRILTRTGLIRDEYIPDPESVGPDDARPRAHVNIPETYTGTSLTLETDPKKCCVMVSGGKDSLLTYSILKELGCKAYPCFFNESGRHWLVALTAYRYFSENVPETMKVWSNLDRLFTFIERNMKIVVPDFQRKSREIYPVRLFWFEHYAFSFMPLMAKYGIGNINFGDEFDDVAGLTFQFRGIRHYYGIYDQTQEFDKYMTRWFAERGIGVKQWSPIRPISGLIVERILAKRYPHMLKLQVSCHSPRLENNTVVPCGRCYKDTGIMLFLLANGIDPAALRYKKETYADLADRILRFQYRLNESELEHSVYLANKLWGMRLPRAKYHWHVETMHFDPISSHVDAIPYCELRKRVFDLLEKYTLGYTYLRGNTWAETSKKEVLKMGGCA